MELRADTHVTVSVFCRNIEHFETGLDLFRSIYKWRIFMNNIVYIVGLVVIVLAILSFFGFR